MEALGDPMRRAILESLAAGPKSVHELADALPVAYEPPDRLVVAWHLDGDWHDDPDPAHASPFEVGFIAEAEDRTRVELEHRHVERHGDGAAAVRGGLHSPNGWDSCVVADRKASGQRTNATTRVVHSGMPGGEVSAHFSPVANHMGSGQPRPDAAGPTGPRLHWPIG